MERDKPAEAKIARKLLPPAEKAKDKTMTDPLTQRMQIHEKTAWMLRRRKS